MHCCIFYEEPTVYNALAQDDTGPATNSLIRHKPKKMERPWFMYACNNLVVIPLFLYKRYYTLLLLTSQIAKFIGPKWRPPRSSRPQMGPMLAPWTLLSWLTSQTPKFMGPTWGPPGHVGPSWAPRWPYEACYQGLYQPNTLITTLGMLLMTILTWQYRPKLPNMLYLGAWEDEKFIEAVVK